MIEHKEIPIEEIILSEENPRDIDDLDLEKLQQDISNDPSFLLQRPPLLNFKSGKYYCYAGTQRVKASKLNGSTSITCFVEENVPKKTQQERMVKDNLHRGKWNEDKLLDLDFELSELKDFGFEDFELNVFTDDVELEEDDFDIELPEDPITKENDLYTLGNHRLLCGDSSKESDVKKLMKEGEKAQLVFTDPPYNIDYQSRAGNGYSEGKYKGKGKIFNDNKPESECVQFYTDVLQNLYKFTTEDCPIYWWFATTNYPLNAEAFNNAGWHISQTIVWLKENMVFGMGQDYHRCYEPCLFGWKKGNKHFIARNLNNLKDVFALSQEDYRDAMDVWYENRDKTNTYVHPTQKPIRLAERALQKHSLRKFIVLDLFGGSGSTLLGCEQSNRKARLMEMDPKYCDAIVKRYYAYCKSINKKPIIKKNGKSIANEDWFKK